jgi:DNA repair protein RadC
MLARELIVSYRAAGLAPDLASGRLLTPRQTAAYLAELQPTAGVRWADEAVEVFMVLLLNVKHEPIAYHLVSRGILTATLVHPREVYRPAIVGGAAAIIVAHNHPSGDPAPSVDDRELTIRLRDAGELIGIPLLDHVVLGSGGAFTSFRELGVLGG